MGFNIGRQDAQIINNVEGDQTISGGQTVIRVDGPAALREVAKLREALVGVPLAEPDAQAVDQQIGALETELRAPSPDAPKVADRLHRVTTTLAAAGALASAGAALYPPLAVLAGLLGALGEPIRRLVGG
jgi:hypothetical protein